MTWDDAGSYTLAALFAVLWIGAGCCLSFYVHTQHVPVFYEVWSDIGIAAVMAGFVAFLGWAVLT